MDYKDLKRLSRKELLELLLEETEKREALELELQKAKEELEDRRIQCENAGSIAEAALKLNKVFEAAQAAADDYLNSIKEANN